MSPDILRKDPGYLLKILVTGEQCKVTYLLTTINIMSFQEIGFNVFEEF